MRNGFFEATHIFEEYHRYFYSLTEMIILVLSILIKIGGILNFKIGSQKNMDKSSKRDVFMQVYIQQ